MGSVGKRKQSFAKLAIGATEKLTARRMTIMRGSTMLSDSQDIKQEEKPKVKLENTYKMAPDEPKRFWPCIAKKEMDEIFAKNIGNSEYDATKCAKMCLDLSVTIRNKMKDHDWPRYKFITNVIMGQCNDQGLETASRAMWDAKNDNYAYVVYKNTSMFAIGVVHAVYFE